MRKTKLMSKLMIAGVLTLTACLGAILTAGAEEISFGALYPLSGNQANTGAEIINGIEFGVDVVNNSYDLELPGAKEEGIQSLDGAKLKPITGDTQGVAEKGMSVAEQIITGKDNAVAIVGAYNSAVAVTIAQVTEKYGFPFICPDCTSPSLTENGFEYFFRLTPIDTTFVNNMINFLSDMNAEKGADLHTVAIVYENSLWGQDFSELATDLLTEAGFEVTLDLVYAADSAELNSEVQKIKNANPDVVIHATYASDAILFMKTYKEQNFAPKVLLANAGGFIEQSYFDALGEDGNYVVTRSVFSSDIGAQKPIIQQVNDIYKEKYGHDMNEYSARAFMGVLVLADALERAGSTDPDAICDALRETNFSADEVIMAWEGITFDEKGQNTLGRGLVGQLENGEIKTVWPFDLATTEPVYPFPSWTDR